MTDEIVFVAAAFGIALMLIREAAKTARALLKLKKELNRRDRKRPKR